MSKSATITVSCCRLHVGWCCAAVWALTLLPSAVAVAAAPDPALRRSEQLDIRRLGKVSENERSVLRIEWRSALTGADEARIVQELLDSLRRMEGTIVEIGRLIRNVPAQKPVAVAVAEEPSESGGFSSRLALANITAAGLVALWWFRRRNSAKYLAAKTIFGASPTGGPPVSPSPLEILPAVAPSVESAPTDAPTAVTPASTSSAAAQKPAHEAPAEPLAGVPRIEPRIASEAIKAAPTPPPVTVPTMEQTASPKLAEVKPSAPLPAAENPVIDFSLEEADPEVVARENARVPTPRADGPPRVPERRQESDVEPTLQLAEIMLSMGLEQGAAQALVEYTEANPRQAVYHWLKLLGIYRSKGLLKEYKETAEKLRKHFNIQAEDAANTGAGETPTLENFSRVAEHVQKVWSQPAECIGYLQHLLEDNREGARAGFPLAVADEILCLIEILKEMSGASQAPGI